jgi:hypothetical protein
MAPKFDEKKLLGAICAMTNGDPTAVFEVSLSNGKTIEGQLSPLDEESDYIRVNPVPANSGAFSYHVSLGHIVYVQRKKK